jgi:hypothetical protein
MIRNKTSVPDRSTAPGKGIVPICFVAHFSLVKDHVVKESNISFNSYRLALC